MQKKSVVAILGGGASGVACAIHLKRNLPSLTVTIYEKNEAPLKKLLATGNGRCNLSNETLAPDCYYGDPALVETVLGFGKEAGDRFLTEDCLSFFQNLGLYTLSEEGRIYPRTMSALTVKSILMDEVNRLGIQVKTGFTVTSVEKTEQGFLVNGTKAADYVVFAMGGKAGAQYGTDGDAYRLLKNFAIRYNPITPALVPMKVKEDTKALHGVRVRGGISLLKADGTLVRSEQGELQLTDYGVSGIAAMQLSSPAAVLLKTETPLLSLDFFPEQSLEYLAEALLSRMEQVPDEPVSHLLSGFLQNKLIPAVAARAGIDPSLPLSALGVEGLSRLLTAIKGYTLQVTGTKSYGDAQVTHGGVPQAALKEKSLEAAKTENLYFCGELLDVDGICGGYNLHFAWGSGCQAAKEIMLKETSCLA